MTTSYSLSSSINNNGIGLNMPAATSPFSPDSPITTADGSVSYSINPYSSPTSSLESTSSVASLSYPSDLNGFGSGKGHSIQFTIFPTKPADVSGTLSAAYSAMTQLYQQGLTAGQNISTSIQTNGVMATASAYTPQAQSAISSAVTQVQNMAQNSSLNSVVTGLQTIGATSPSINPEVQAAPTAQINLYMPPSLAFGYQAQYDKLSIAEAINSVPLVGQISSALTSTLSGNAAAKAFQQKIGYVFNPQQQTLFEGIDFREFDLEFTFSPKSSNETMMVQQIIRQFRIAAAPTKVAGVAGFFWIPPSQFQLQFMFNGVVNTAIPPVRTCVLQSVNVNYAQDGWAAFNDGSPVQTVLSLSFRELDLVDSTSIQAESQFNNGF
jgi:hypothetical protein